MQAIVCITTLGYAVGILHQSIPASARIWLLCILSCTAIVYIFSTEKRIYCFIHVALFGVAFLLGIFSLALQEQSPVWNIYRDKDGTTTSISGLIVSDPTHEDTRQRFILREDGSGVQFRVSVDPYQKVAFADHIEVTGTFRVPSNDFLKDTENSSFDYVHYLRAQGVAYEIQGKSISMRTHTNEMPLRQFLYRLKGTAIAHIEKFIPRPESSLASGILLGARDALPESYTDMFIKTGTIHIVALSGYNISVVAETTMKVFASFLPYMISLGCGIFAIILFVILSGAQATAIRAGIMGSLMLIARLVGRPYAIGQALALTALIMLVINPYLLCFDRSFQLSFIATLGVVFISPLFEKRMTRLPEKWGIRGVIATTCAATISVSPFLLWTTGMISLVSLPINSIIVPMVPLIMLGTALTGLFGFFLRPIALVFGVCTYVCIKLMLWCITRASLIPFAQIQVSYGVGFAVLVFYVLLLWWVIRKYSIQNTIDKTS